LDGAALVPGRRVAVRIAERDRAGDPVRTVLGYLDLRLAGVVPVDLIACLGAVHRVAQRSGRAAPHGPDDLVHPSPAGGHGGLGASAEHAGQPVGAESGVLADTAVIEDSQLQSRIGIPLVGDPLGILSIGEPGPGMASVAQWLDRRGPAAAEGDLWCGPFRGS